MSNDKKVDNDYDLNDYEVVSTPEEIEELRSQYVDQTPVSQRLLEQVGAGAAGVGMGITAGFGEEAIAGIQSRLTDVPYEESRDRLREYYKRTQEKYPGSTTMGELVGSMAIPAGPLVRATKGGTWVQRVAGEMGEAIPIATAASVGYSDAPVQEMVNDGKIQIPEDVQRNAAMAALIPPGIRSAQSVASGVGTLARGLPGVNPIVEGFQEGRKGYQIFNKGLTEHKTIVRMQNMAETVANKVGEEGAKLPALIKQATSEGKQINLESVDEALNKINELKNAKTTDEFLQKELQTLENFLSDYRMGKEVETTIPGTTKVVPGKSIQSGEEIVEQQLKEKQALGEAADVVGAPEATAEQKLRERFAKKEITSEIPTTREFKPEQVEVEGVQALRVIDPNEFIDAQVINKIKPGEIQTIETTQGKVMGMKLPSGKFYGKVVPDQAAATEVAFKKTPDVTETVRITPATGGKSTPEEAYELRKTLNKLLYGRGGEASLKDPSSREVVQNIIKQLDVGLESSTPGFEKQLQNVATLKSALEDASLVAKAKTKGKATQQSGKKLFQEAAKTEGEGTAGAEARFDIRQFFKSLKEVDPELAAKIQPRFEKQTKQYGLATGIRETPLQTATPRGLVGSLSSLAAKGGAYTGYGVRKIDNMVNKLVGKGTAAEPLITTLKKLTDENLTIPARNALIFKIAQDPSSRELLRSIESDTDEFEIEE